MRFVQSCCLAIMLLFMPCIFTACATNTMPIAATGAAQPILKGEATCTEFLWFFRVGDCSIEKAMRQGGIKHISTIERKVIGLPGIYEEHTTLIMGE